MFRTKKQFWTSDTKGTQRAESWHPHTENVGETVHVGVTVSSESLACCVGASGCFLHVDECFEE